MSESDWTTTWVIIGFVVISLVSVGAYQSFRFILSKFLSSSLDEEKDGEDEELP